jgi:MFS transporter, DHA2 family, multidrug resistance protein
MPGEETSKAGGWKPSYNPWLIAVAVMLATFMEVIDTSIASVAIPYIAGSLSATNNQATWVLTSYLVANAIFLPTSIWFAQKFGRKRFLIFSVIVFTVASFACGIATSLGFILVARAVQGMGGGALQPLSQAILLESFPKEKQGQALGLYALGVVVAPVLGPTLGGFLTDHVSWRWAFYINIPVGILAVVMQSKFLEDPPYIKSANPGSFDKWGFGLLAIWSGSLQFICDKGQEEDWFGSTTIRWAAVLFVTCFLGFLVLEFTRRKPLVGVCLLRNRNFAVGCLLIFLFGCGIYGLTTILPLFYQTLMGYDATSAGLAVSPRGLGSIASAAIVGAIASKVDSRKLVALGFALFGAMSFWTSSVTLDISPTSLFWPVALSGFALPLVFISLSQVAFGTLKKEEIGSASGMFNLLRNIGGSLGISAASTIAARHLQTHRNELAHALSGSNPIVQRTLAQLTIRMHTHAGPVVAMKRAYSAIERGLDQQAQLFAYVDDFRYLALICAVCVPITFLMKKARAQGAGAE